MAFTSFLSAQTLDIGRVNLNNSGTLTSYYVTGGTPLINMANLGTFNPSLGQTLKISGRYVRFDDGTSSCIPNSMRFTYELFKNNTSGAPIAFGYAINLPNLTTNRPITEWNIADGSADIDIVQATTTDGNYILRVYYSYFLAGSAFCPAASGFVTTSDLVEATFVVNRTPLAVEMSTLSARKESNKAIAILWKTAKEEGNNGFQIERSSDGENFSAIGKIKGEINSTVEKTYNFSDAAPLQGVNYYRIKSKALDGKEAISKVVSVNFSDKVKTALQVYPNPVHSALQVEVMSDEESTKTVQVFDLAGRVILTKNTAFTKGLNNILLDVNTVLAGTYLVKVGSDVSRFVKMQ
jgi:hypothetical protein